MSHHWHPAILARKLYHTAKPALFRFGLPLIVGLLLSLALLLELPKKTPRVHTTTQLRMGTLVSISTWNVPPPQEARAVSRAFAEIARIEHLMSQHQPTSEVAQINSVSRGTLIPISNELGKLLQRGLEVWRYSEGAFAMDLEALTTLWGFSTTTEMPQPPTKKALADWLRLYPKAGGMTLQGDVDHGFKIRLKSDGVGLDLGGIAKGYAIDQAIAVLRQEGVANGMVNAGGDLRIIGSKGSTPWRIGLQHPRHTDKVIAVSLLTGDRAMVTSGDYERFFFHNGSRYHHILDPGTAQPSRSGLSSVSVQAANATIADALSTAIYVLGAESGLALLQHFPGSAVLLVTETGEPFRSPGFVGNLLANP